MAVVMSAIPVGNQEIERLAVDLLRGVAEDALRAGVEESDPVVGVDGDDRVGRERDDPGEVRLGAPQLALNETGGLGSHTLLVGAQRRVGHGM
jgi:hypothetical protein